MFLITLWTCSPNSAQMYCHQLLWSARKPNFVTTTWAPVTVWFALASIPLTTGWRSLPISLPSQPTWCKLQDLGRPVPQCQSRPLSPLCLATFCFSMKFLSSRKQDGSWQPYPGHPETLCIEIWKPCSRRPGEERAQLSRRLRSSLAVASVLDMMLPDNVVPWREIPELPQMNAKSTSINQPNQAEIPTPPVRHQRDLAVRPQSRQEQLRNAEESSRLSRLQRMRQDHQPHMSTRKERGRNGWEKTFPTMRPATPRNYCARNMKKLLKLRNISSCIFSCSASPA